MTGYIVECDYTVTIAEVSYEKQTAKMCVGVKLVSNFIGRTDYVSAKVPKDKVFPTLEGASYQAQRLLAAKIATYERKLDYSRSQLCIVESFMRLAYAQKQSDPACRSGGSRCERIPAP